MNEHDLLEAIGRLPDETVNKYALPETKHQETENAASAAGKERIKMKQTGEKTKQPFRIGKLSIAAVVALCIGLNGALIYGISQMKKTPGMTPGMAMSDVVDRDKVYIGNVRAMPTGVSLELHNETEEHYDVVKAEVWQNGEKLEDARPAQLSLPAEQDTDVFYKPFTFDQISVGKYTLMTYGEDGVTVSAFGNVDFEISEEFANAVWLPDVTGMKIDDAQAKLEEYDMEANDIKLGIQYAAAKDEGAEDGDVLYCFNAFHTTEKEDGGKAVETMFDGQGYWVRRGDTYQLTVCTGSGDDLIIVPDMTGWEFETAKQTVLGLGLYVDKRSSYDAEVPAGKVISTDPEAPAELKTGSYVRVTVSLGPCPETFPVPNFTGMDVDEALEVARSLGLVLSISETTYDEPSGTIVLQSIEAGEEVSADTVIGVTVALAKKETVVRMQFDVPDDAAGHYHIGVYQNGILRAIGSTFAPAVERGLAYPEPAGGTTSVVIELAANETAEVTAILVNEDNGMEATIGTYRVSGETKSCEPLNANISAAFEAVQ